MVEFNFQKIDRDPNKLSPIVAEAFSRAQQAALEDGFNVYLFEGFRSYTRQAWLYEKGRTTPGPIVTNAKPWKSWHQYGLAVDIAFKVGKNWSWDGPYDKVSHYFIDQGFTWLHPFEQAHFEITKGMSLNQAYELLKSEGIEAVHRVLTF